MVGVLAYKVAVLVLIAVAGGTSGGVTYYYEQQTSALNTKVSNLNTEINTNANQISNLNTQVSQLQSQNGQLQSEATQIQSQNAQILTQNDQLLTQIAQLQAQLTNLTRSQVKTNSSLISTGSIDVVGYGAVQYVTFTADPTQTKLNITFSATYGSIVVMLLNPAQHDTLNNCNCILYGNYTASTWQSPESSSYHTVIDIPTAGPWYFAFFDPPGTGSERIIIETLSLISSSTTITSSVIAAEVTLTNGCCPSTNDFSTGAPPTAVVSLGAIPYSGHITVSWVASTNPSTRFSFTIQVYGADVTTNSTSSGGFSIQVYANAVSNAWFSCYDYTTDQFGAHCNSNLTYSITYWH